MQLRELNYILIPRSNETWQAWRRTRIGRLMWWLTGPARVLTATGRVLAVATLMGAAAGVDVGGSLLYMVFAGLFSMLFVAYLTRSFARLPAIELTVEAPERVEQGRAATLTVVLRNTSTRGAYALRLQGPFLPWDGDWIGPTPSLEALGPQQEARLELRIKFLSRGDRLVGQLALCSVRPLGLVRGPNLYTAPVRLMVVPRALALPPALFERALLEGETQRRGFAPEAQMWAFVRPYQPGDRLRDVHARSWARLGEPMVRSYEAPQDPQVTLWIFTQASSSAEGPFDVGLALASGLVDQLLRRGLSVQVSVIGGGPVAPFKVGGREGIGRAAFADRLAVVTRSRPGPTPHPAPPQSGPLYLIFCGWHEGAKPLWTALASRPGVHGWLAVEKSAQGREAEALGLKVLSLAAVKALADGR